MLDSLLDQVRLGLRSIDVPGYTLGAGLLQCLCLYVGPVKS
jgi:hypothetical protein